MIEGANGTPATRPCGCDCRGDSGSNPDASTTLARLLYLIERYQRARGGPRSREYEARNRLFDYAAEVMDGQQSPELDAGRGTGGAGVGAVIVQRMGGKIRISPAGHDGDSETPVDAGTDRADPA